MANPRDQVPASTHTQFNIGLISKVFAAAAILMLRDDSLIGLDEPVIAHLPEFTMAHPRHTLITVRMLLNHTSGLPGTHAAMTASPWPKPSSSAPQA
jgi:CubicO group peptidase (beta-lactamase class C family)